MRNMWNANGGIYLGQENPWAEYMNPALDESFFPTSSTQRLHTYCGDGHLLTIGPSGSGKSRRLLCTNLLSLRSISTLVIDPKGELAVLTAKHRHRTGSKVIVFDPFDVIKRRYPSLPERHDYFVSKGFNPLAALDPESDDFTDDAKALSEALISIDNRGETHWAKSAQALIAGIVMALVVNRHQHPEEANLGTLRKVVGSSPEEIGGLVTQYVERFGEKCPAIAAKLNRFKNISTDNKEMYSILSTAVTQTDWIDSPPIQRAMSVTDEPFDFGEMKRRSVTVYLVLPPERLETHATWLRLMLTSFLTPLIRDTAEHGGASVPVLFVLDEFAQLGRLEVIERTMALLRSYGVKLWCVLQDLSQLQAIYHARWESFIANAGVVQSFAANDVTTREYMAKLSGSQLYWVGTGSSSVSNSYGSGGCTQSIGNQSSWSYFHAPVFPEHVLAQLKGAESVIFRSGCPPQRAWLPDPTEIAGLSQLLDAADREKNLRPLVGGPGAAVRAG